MLAIMGSEDAVPQQSQDVPAGVDHLDVPQRPNSRAATVESDPEDNHRPPSRSPSPRTTLPPMEEAPRPPSQVGPPPMQYDPTYQYQPYTKEAEQRQQHEYHPQPVEQVGAQRHRKPSFLAHLVGPKDGHRERAEVRPPRFYPERDYIQEVGDGVGQPVKKRHDSEWLNGFLNDVAGEVRDRR